MAKSVLPDAVGPTITMILGRFCTGVDGANRWLKINLGNLKSKYRRQRVSPLTLTGAKAPKNKVPEFCLAVRDLA
jgi:hypothetical protein